MAQDKHTQLLVELGVIKSQLSNLNDKVAIQNGRVARTEERVSKLEGADNREQGEKKGQSNARSQIITAITLTAVITGAVVAVAALFLGK